MNRIALGIVIGVIAVAAFSPDDTPSYRGASARGGGDDYGYVDEPRAGTARPFLQQPSPHALHYRRKEGIEQSSNRVQQLESAQGMQHGHHRVPRLSKGNWEKCTGGSL